jgi:hypothetical protein
MAIAKDGFTDAKRALRPDDLKADYGPLLQTFLDEIVDKIFEEMREELLAKARPVLYQKAQEVVKELEGRLLTHYDLRADQLSVWLCVKDDVQLKRVEPK